MLLWGYQLVAQCSQMKRTQMCSELIKTFSNCPAELFWNMKDFLQASSVSCSGLGTYSVTTLLYCGTLHAHGMVWYSSTAAAWPACSYYVQCNCWRRRVLVFCSVSCAFSPKDPLPGHSQAQHKALSLLPDVPPAVHEVVPWTSEPVAPCALGSWVWDTCKLVPPAVIGLLSFVGAVWTVVAQTQGQERGWFQWLQSMGSLKVGTVSCAFSHTSLQNCCCMWSPKAKLIRAVLWKYFLIWTEQVTHFGIVGN